MVMGLGSLAAWAPLPSLSRIISGTKGTGGPVRARAPRRAAMVWLLGEGLSRRTADSRSERGSVLLALEHVEVGLGARELGIDRERGLEALGGGLGVVDREVDEAQARESAEVPGLQGQRAADVLDRALVVLDHVAD